MKAKVVEVSSASKYTDGKRRVTLRFEAADSLYKELRVPEDMLGGMVSLDDEIEFNLVPLASIVKVHDEPLPTTGDEVVHDGSVTGALFNG